MISMLKHRCYLINNKDGEISATGPKFQDKYVLLYEMPQNACEGFCHVMMILSCDAFLIEMTQNLIIPFSVPIMF